MRCRVKESITARRGFALVKCRRLYFGPKNCNFLHFHLSIVKFRLIRPWIMYWVQLFQYLLSNVFTIERSLKQPWYYISESDTLSPILFQATHLMLKKTAHRLINSGIQYFECDSLVCLPHWKWCEYFIFLDRLLLFSSKSNRKFTKELLFWHSYDLSVYLPKAPHWWP